MNAEGRNRQSKCGTSLNDKFVKMDRFGQKFELTIEEGKMTLQSRMGAICTIFIRMLILAFTAYKVSVLEAKTRVDVLSVLQTDAIDGTEVFGLDQGLNLAIAVFDDVNMNFEVDPAYGSVRF